MPQMLPSTICTDAPDSEKKVFEIFKKDLPKDWIVIHGKRFVLNEGNSSKEGEVDFLILNPHRGYLGLEVKGGGEVGRDDDGWYSIDYYKNKHRLKHDPGAQAQKAVHSINKKLLRSNFLQRNRLSFSWGVVLPDITVEGDIDVALPRGKVIDSLDLDYAKESIVRLFDEAGIIENLIAREIIDEYLKILSPTFHLVRSLKNTIKEEELDFVRLTNEQHKFFRLFKDFPRLAIQGTAGTGKTLVAMEKARQLSSDGLKVLFLCYNRPLAENLAQKADGFEVTNFHNLCKEIVEKSGAEFPIPTESSELNGFWNDKVPDLMLEAVEKNPDYRYDAIIVDEGQDFKKLWWLAIEELLTNSETGNFYVFYDPNQAIYGEDVTETLGLKSMPLEENCRNTRRIAEYMTKQIDIENIMKEDSPDGTEVIQQTWSTEKEMIDKVRKLVHRFVVEEGIANDEITLLTTHALNKSPIWNAGKLGNFTLAELGVELEPNQIRMTTLHSFKGLESDVVIICDVDHNSPGFSQRHLYVACSRAKHVLAVLTKEG